jgi:GT2 family glycosyltransferase
MTSSNGTPQVSVVIVSFNTRDLLRDCLKSFAEQSAGITTEVIVVDNASKDKSADMVAAEFPDVRLIRTEVNLGFAGANNLGFPHATGRYVLLLNSDAFLKPQALQRCIQHMEQEPKVGIGGARLIGRDGGWQPSARLFPSPLNQFLIISGLSAKHQQSKFFGRADRTWANPGIQADVDWVPGAFSLIRRDALEKVGYFDESFFLYFEEVDLCKRFKEAGYIIRYYPDVEVVHWGGESSKTLESMRFARVGSQLTLWQLRSAFLYFRKHHGSTAWVVKEMERQWHGVRARRNVSRAADKSSDSRMFQSLIEQAWKDTSGGRVSPVRPW